jgi:hypothetical protein
VIEPVPIEQEAVDHAVHVKLGWRSWVWRQTPSSPILTHGY